ncbi:alpha/beta fold hydrolase [Caballeronia humi]|uniref:Alpha/beta hydrolase family protein n=1 Tax=Caballeronia humi TaxID=326474 RepID=A0A158FFJ2_9BURK|nr:alpha/beta hydrolase [Caballeronia humi]SAL17800.1 Alpha/beta hydrolase family protein [Caballeronia humi]
MIEIVTLCANASRGAVALECEWLGGKCGGAPAIVFLAKGTIDPSSDWPARLVRTLGLRGLVCGLAGGLSLRDQARDILPALFEALDIDPRMWIVGYREGATIALLYAAEHPRGLAGAILIAPRMFSQSPQVAHLLRARAAFEPAKLRERFACHAAHHEWTIEGELHGLRCPLLAIRDFPDDDGSAASHIDLLELHAHRADRLETHAHEGTAEFPPLDPMIRFISAHSPLSR